MNARDRFVAAVLFTLLAVVLILLTSESEPMPTPCGVTVTRTTHA